MPGQRDGSSSLALMGMYTSTTSGVSRPSGETSTEALTPAETVALPSPRSRPRGKAMPPVYRISEASGQASGIMASAVSSMVFVSRSTGRRYSRFSVINSSFSDLTPYFRSCWLQVSMRLYSEEMVGSTNDKK